LPYIDEKREENSRNKNDVQNHSSSWDPDLLSSPNPISPDNENESVEIEHNLKTKIVHGEEDVTNIIKHAHLNCKNSLHIYCDKNGFSVLINTSIFKELFTVLRNNGVMIKIITEITVDNIEHCKQVIDLFNANIKYLDTVKGNFALLDDKTYLASPKLIGAKLMPELIYSNEKEVVEQNRYLFETLWKEAKPAEQKIREIQDGILPIETFIIDDPNKILSYARTQETTRIIENSNEIRKLLLHLVKNSKKEILIVYPSSKAVDLQKKIGTLDILLKKSQENISVKILSPTNVNLDKMIYLHQSLLTELELKNINIREISKQQELKPTVLMIDRKHVLALELKNDTSDTFEEATGLATYSTSDPTVLSYISIFESLWEQTDMSISLRMANEKLVRTEQMERDFINTAAHELRTPTQAIMGYAELDSEVFDDLLKNAKVVEDDDLRRIITHLQKHFDAISRNSTRLDDLISNLLDVSRIESSMNNSLSLHTEKLDLIKEIKESIKNQLDQKIKIKNIEINFINDSLDEQCWIYADRSRLNQIISNLIGNAIKFSNQNGRIDIMIKDNAANSNERHMDEINSFVKTKKSDIQKRNGRKKEMDEIFVNISDTGKGISTKIMPKLFEKFITDSDTGTGLGLYITRNLVEAHGGRIWAFNNNDGIGSTFIFSLPKMQYSISDNK